VGRGGFIEVDRLTGSRAVRRVENDPETPGTVRAIRGELGHVEPKERQH
jgi:hypothetical protein